MREDRLERICEMVRSLKEEGGPTMSVGAGGYTGAAATVSSDINCLKVFILIQVLICNNHLVVYHVHAI